MSTTAAPARPLFTTATGVQISLRHVLSQITGTPARDRASDVRQGRVTASTAEDFACLVIDAIESAERYPSDLGRALRLVPSWIDSAEQAGALRADVRVMRSAMEALRERNGMERVEKS
jgi:hypothetical protein